MAYDIFGQTLARGHCEVHPWIHEEYPCYECIRQKREHDAQMAAYEKDCQAQADDYYAEQHAHWLLEGGTGCA